MTKQKPELGLDPVVEEELMEQTAAQLAEQMTSATLELRRHITVLASLDPVLRPLPVSNDAEE